MNQTHRPRPCRAFTLIELLVVLAIIMILAAIIFPALNSARNRGYDADCMNNLKQLGAALYQYATSIGGNYFPKIDTAAEPAAFGGTQANLVRSLSEFVPTNSSVWWCKRYLRAKNMTMTSTNTGYFYWAWDNVGGTAYEMDTGATSNRWLGKGLGTNLPGAVLMSDRFEGSVVGPGPDEQYHAGQSTAVSLDSPGTMVLLTGGTVIRVSPTRGIVR
ncbi:MAG: prepilin-type N-terminal cleavage/methylation domain-containing protein [Verrucomicrobiota bacterium]